MKKYLPDWERYGKSAGPLRNKIMVDKADFIICFWNGKSRGTASTVRYASKDRKAAANQIYIKPVLKN